MVKIQILKTSITSLQTDAIVNAANESLLAGAGVCRAIFQAAGAYELQAACNAIDILSYPKNVQKNRAPAFAKAPLVLLNNLPQPLLSQKLRWRYLRNWYSQIPNISAAMPMNENISSGSSFTKKLIASGIRMESTFARMT